MLLSHYWNRIPSNSLSSTTFICPIPFINKLRFSGKHNGKYPFFCLKFNILKLHHAVIFGKISIQVSTASSKW